MDRPDHLALGNGPLGRFFPWPSWPIVLAAAWPGLRRGFEPGNRLVLGPAPLRRFQSGVGSTTTSPGSVIGVAPAWAGAAGLLHLWIGTVQPGTTE